MSRREAFNRPLDRFEQAAYSTSYDLFAVCVEAIETMPSPAEMARRLAHAEKVRAYDRERSRAKRLARKARKEAM